MNPQQSSLVEIKSRQAVEEFGVRRMVGPEDGLVDGEGALEQRFGVFIVLLVVVPEAHVVDDRPDIGARGGGVQACKDRPGY